MGVQFTTQHGQWLTQSLWRSSVVVAVGLFGILLAQRWLPEVAITVGLLTCLLLRWVCLVGAWLIYRLRLHTPIECYYNRYGSFIQVEDHWDRLGECWMGIGLYTGILSVFFIASGLYLHDRENPPGLLIVLISVGFLALEILLYTTLSRLHKRRPRHLRAGASGRWAIDPTRSRQDGGSNLAGDDDDSDDDDGDSD
jgi:hypothetical protein